MADTMYIKIGQKIRVTQPSVSIGELGDLWCANASIQAHCKALHYTTVHGQRAVGDILKVTQLIQKSIQQFKLKILEKLILLLSMCRSEKKTCVGVY